LVDCQGCLDGEIERLADYLNEDEKAYALSVFSLLDDAGPDGMGKKDILVTLGATRS
jgi:hypothetical protein